MTSRAVHLFVFENLADWEASFAIAGIQNPRFQRAPGRYRVVTVAPTREPVTTMGGVRILPDLALSEIGQEDSAMLILPGGEAWEQGKNREAIAKARAFIAACVPVAAICGATLALAGAGLLDNRYHTSNTRDYLAASGYRGGRFYREVAAIADQGVITASGVAPLEFAREIFEALHLYDSYALDAWYTLFKYGDATAYCELAQYATQ
ncbi:MAG: type 1 glutamine amidotransferase family protein [Terracidiphilus sp.]